MIEWSTTRSTGTSGSIVLASLPISCGDVAHRRQVGQQRHAGEVLQHDAGDDERDFVEARRVRLPAGELDDVLGQHLLAVAVAQHRLQHDADRDRQARDVRVLPGQRGQRVERAFLAGRGLERLQGGSESVGHREPRMIGAWGVRLRRPRHDDLEALEIVAKETGVARDERPRIAEARARRSGNREPCATRAPRAASAAA